MLDWMHSEQGNKRGSGAPMSFWRMVLHIPTCVMIFKYAAIDDGLNIN